MSAQVGRETFPNIRSKFMVRFSKLALSRSAMKCMVENGEAGDQVLDLTMNLLLILGKVSPANLH